MRSVLAFAAAVALAACRPSPSPVSPLTAHVTLAESVPVEAEDVFDHPEVPNAPDLWVAMIDGATQTIDLAEFYASDGATDAEKKASKLRPVLDALARARARGVRVRFLTDASFAPKYPETLAELERNGADVRRYDVGRTSGGVQHAKYFIVDDRDVFLGSQNFDWRALSHIYEVGARIGSAPLATALREIFELDWALASGAAPARVTGSAQPPATNDAVRSAGGDRVSLVASPRGYLPRASSWDLTHLLAAIAGAKDAIHVEVLTYKTKNRDGSPFTTLDDALRAAAGRGVRVSLLVSDWAAKPGSDGLAALQALDAAPNVEVRVLSVPAWSGGEVPFARVAHAKFMIVDGHLAWIGTSNWEGDYFLRSRNVGVVLDGHEAPPKLDRVFVQNWNSVHARKLSSSHL